jgi:hypothetical protein
MPMEGCRRRWWNHWISVVIVIVDITVVVVVAPVRVRQ